MKRAILIFGIVIAFVSCGGNGGNQSQASDNRKQHVTVPDFNGDSAYYFVQKQTKFGPRVPQSAAHQQCAEWMVKTLNGYADKVYEQDFKTRIYDGTVYNGKNIIATFNPDAKKRIVVSAHWDSRPYADNDPDEKNWHTPIDGANDGASGCGVMMEMARLMKSNRINDNLGVDFIFFDLEDFGTPKWANEELHNDFSWGLGSQYWAQNPHIFGYAAYYGILLDMVGASDPRFPKEYYSLHDAEWVVNKVWRIARDMGYGDYFKDELGDPINDDHVYVTHYADIPTIDIIHLVGDEDRTSCFFPYWHTINDNLQHIDKNTLQIVGNVVMNVVYNE